MGRNLAVKAGAENLVGVGERWIVEQVQADNCERACVPFESRRALSCPRDGEEGEVDGAVAHHRPG
jgi:hypothetical protein